MATTPAKRACSVCGTLLADDSSYCPVCALRGAVETQSDSISDVSSELRFEHYQVLRNQDGKPLELGHGGMGVTYKAIDTNLRCAVALKVISARFIGDESARRRFVREARAAASVRHPNVASVFHLGKSGNGYFYAMEFVEGETLENVIKRTGQLELKLTLEIARQAAAGLAAVHKGKLVHRDIKPSNIMVSSDEGGSVTVKIIDLGLAKSLDEQGSQTAISMPGGFAGTPEFASPEQFAGVGVDIRSDLYSLGIVLWEMLTGRTPFRGTPGEAMHQHLYATLPVERLKHLPLQVVALIEVLLKKNPAHRFQNPEAFLNAIHTVIHAIETRRTVKDEKSQVAVRNKLGPRPKQPPTIRTAKRSVAVLPFDTLGHGKRNIYFADGVHDEILSNLAKVSQLKVISRTSVMTYRPGNERNLRSIAESLGVANVVEGTVRRDRSRVRITIRLVDARTDKALWSESYDRDLTDIFATQSEIAQTVASKLNVRLSTKQRKDIEEKPTENLEAYDLYLQAKQLFAPLAIRIIDDHQDILKAIKLLREAIRQDPQFALAYCSLTRAHDELYRLDHDDEQRALADAAINEALRLRPDLPEVHLHAAFHLFKCYRNYERAHVHVAIAERASPNNPLALAGTAWIDRRVGRLEESTRFLEKALLLDPQNAEFIKHLAVNYLKLRRNREFESTYDRVFSLGLDIPLLILERAFLMLHSKADLKGCDDALEGIPGSMKHDKRILSAHFSYALWARDWAMAKEILRNRSNEELYFSEAEALVPVGCLQIWLARVQSDYPVKGAHFVAARDQLHQKVEARPHDPALLSALGLIDAALGRSKEAIKEAKRAVEMLPIYKDAWDGPLLVYNLAAVFSLMNQTNLAFEQLANLMNTQGGILYGELKLDPAWDPLRKDPRFDKLLAELAPRD